MSQQVVSKTKSSEAEKSKRAHEVRTATVDQSDDVIDALVMAFASDPVARWIYPNPRNYLQHFPELVRMYGGKSFDYDVTNYVEGFAGSALWLPPKVHPDGEAMAELLQNTMPEARQEPTLTAFEKLEEYHPNEPHWHLPFIGVEPSQQRNGYGSALLEEGLAKCDEEGVPVYLESTNPENVSLYRRHGFEKLGTIEEGEMPPFIPMVRQP